MATRYRTQLHGIDGLRALAALSVVANHVWYDGVAGQMESFGPLTNWIFYRLDEGLTLFFALSGFLLYRQFAAKTLSDSPFPPVRNYAENRFLRIVPAYWVILGLVALVGLGQWGEGNVAVLLAQNLALLQNYTPSGLQTGIGPAWSLVVEMAFYAALPAVAWLAWKAARGPANSARRVRCALAPAIGMLLVGWISRAAAHVTIDSTDTHAEQWGHTWHAVFERSLLCQADLFGWGMIAAVLVCLVDSGQLDGRVLGRAAAACTVIAWFGSTALLVYGGIDYAVYKTISSAACAALIVFVVTPGYANGQTRRILESRPLVSVGLISYSVYLWHLPVISFLRDHGLTAAGKPQFMLNVIVVLAATLPLAALTYRLVERPAMRRRRPRDLDEVRVVKERIEAAP